MAGKIFKSILCVAAAVLLAALLVITGVLYRYFGELQQSRLKDELRFAADATEKLGREYLEGLTADRYRLTWVAADGSVLFDSHADPSSMENHADREEIREAMTSGTGSSSRRSSTLTEQTLYEAIRLSDASVLRISVSHATAVVLMVDMLRPLAVIALLAILLSAWLARRMAKRVVDPLNRLDLDNPMENIVYDELSPLLRRIYSQRQEITEQLSVLKQKQDEFDQITGSLNEALVILDMDGRIVSINQAAKKLFGADDGCIGDDFLTIDRKPEMRRAIDEAQTRGQTFFRASANGREYQFDLSRIDSEGSTLGVVILAFDATEQISAERSRREFTANVSHELKTPLQSIIGSAELMENGLVKPEDLPRFVGHIRQEAARLLSLINDIIRLSQLDEGSAMPCEAVSLLSLSGEVCEALRDAADAKQVTMEASGVSGTINGVPQLLYEVIYNLCDNAIKYNRPGGTVSVSVEEEGGRVRLTVRDTGIGIAPEHQVQVFERFYRVDKSHSRQSGGTGLGLSIVKHAVRYHHGKIELASEPGQGTSICVTFQK